MNPVLEQTWRDPPGLVGTLAAINHKTIARRYLITAFAFFIGAGLMAVVMRLQLAMPENTLVGPDLYNQLFTVHGTVKSWL
jgi:cytochrome c oxidase subunit I+III